MKITSDRNTADVNADKQLLVAGSNISAIGAASLKGDAYSWCNVSADIDATDTGLLIRNDSKTRLLVIDSCLLWVDVATKIQIFCPGPGITLAGTAVAAKNLNRASNKTAPASAYADETANTQANIIANIFVPDGSALAHTTVDFNGAIVLSYDESIGFDIVAESAAYNITVFGYYVDAE